MSWVLDTPASGPKAGHRSAGAPRTLYGASVCGQPGPEAPSNCKTRGRRHLQWADDLTTAPRQSAVEFHSAEKTSGHWELRGLAFLLVRGSREGLGDPAPWELGRLAFDRMPGLLFVTTSSPGSAWGCRSCLGAWWATEWIPLANMAGVVSSRYIRTRCPLPFRGTLPCRKARRHSPAFP